MTTSAMSISLSPSPSLSLSSLPGPLGKCKFQSFFSLLKYSFDSLHDRKGEISKVHVVCRLPDISHDLNLYCPQIKKSVRVVLVSTDHPLYVDMYEQWMVSPLRTRQRCLIVCGWTHSLTGWTSSSLPSPTSQQKSELCPRLTLYLSSSLWWSSETE